MELRPWQLLPDEMRTKEVRKYYNILMKHRMWLEMKRVLDVIVAGIMLAVLIIPMGIIALSITGTCFFQAGESNTVWKNFSYIQVQDYG